MFYGLPEEVAKSWKVHTDAFPILSSAFEYDLTTRIQLTTALNQISNKITDRAIDILGEIEERCNCDVDRCAWLFCMALAYEMSGKQEQMINYYYQCCQYAPDFYLPYLKIAKSAHTNQNFGLAKSFYQKTLKVISHTDAKQDRQMQMIEASVSSNLASCYTMMHDYSMAALMLDYSCNAMPIFPERSGTYAVLYAVTGEADKAKKYLEILQKEAPAMYASSHGLIKEILCGTHPHFCIIEPDGSSVASFWTTFNEKEKLFREQLDQGMDNRICGFISDTMTNAFPFMQKQLRVRAHKSDHGYTVELTDYYSISLTDGYNKLISDIPNNLKADWNFTIVHD